MKLRQIVNETLGLLRRELILILPRIRTHIAMAAFQVAGPGGIPDHHRPHALRCAVPHLVRILRIAQGIPELR